MWCFGNTSYDALLVSATSLYDPSATSGQYWSENTSLAAPVAQTWEIMYYDGPDTVYYAGTYEFQANEKPIRLTYTGLSDSVRLSPSSLS